MATEEFAFDPPTGLNDTSVYLDTPASNAQARSDVQTGMDQLQTYLNDTIVPQLDAGGVSDKGITEPKLDDDAVSTRTIIDNAVTEVAIADGSVTEAKQTLADNTTNDVSTSAHGYAPKAPDDATQYLDGTGNYSVPPASLEWDLVYTSGTLTGSSNEVIPTQVGKNEMMLQFRIAAGTKVWSTNIYPLDSSGIVIPSTFQMTSQDATSSLDNDGRSLNQNSATNINVGVSSGYQLNGTTYLEKLYVFTR